MVNYKEEVGIIGQENNQIFMKESLRQAKEMEEGLSGGRMVAGMKVSLRMECSVDMGFFIDMVGRYSMKVSGIMECLMVKVHSILKMAKDMKVYLKRISFMGKVYFIKMILLFMGSGRIINFLWLIW